MLAGLDGGAALDGGTLVSVGPSSGEESLAIYTHAGYPITATVLCVTPAPNVVADVHWRTGWAPTQILGTTASSRCFLSQVTAQSGGFGSYNDNVTTFQSVGSRCVRDKLGERRRRHRLQRRRSGRGRSPARTTRRPSASGDQVTSHARGTCGS